MSRNKLTNKLTNHIRQRAARESTLENGGVVYARRPYGNRVTIADLHLGILRALPDRSIRMEPFVAARTGVTMLDPSDLRRAMYRSRKLHKLTVEELHERLANDLPGSHSYELEKQRVKNIDVFGDPDAPVLALELDSGLITNEAYTMINTLEVLGGISIMDEVDYRPHISIARFPGLQRIPREIITAVENLAPSRATLGSLGFELYQQRT